jgi:hypothetical protein
MIKNTVGTLKFVTPQNDQSRSVIIIAYARNPAKE